MIFDDGFTLRATTVDLHSESMGLRVRKTSMVIAAFYDLCNGSRRCVTTGLLPVPEESLKSCTCHLRDARATDAYGPHFTNTTWC